MKNTQIVNQIMVIGDFNIPKEFITLYIHKVTNQLCIGSFAFEDTSFAEKSKEIYNTYDEVENRLETLFGEKMVGWKFLYPKN